jgi:4-hydroxymandelate oxidase
MGTAEITTALGSADPAAVDPASGADAAGPLCLDDYRLAASRRVPTDVWDFIEGGADDERTVAANRAAFDRYRLRPRTLVDVSIVDTSTTLLGAPLATPLGIAPTAYHRLVDPDGEVATARGAGATGALFVVSMFASRTVEDIAAAATGPLWLQLYWLHQRDVMAEVLARADQAGYQALVLTVDVPRLGRRRRDIRNAFTVGGGVVAANIDPSVMAPVYSRSPGRSALAQHTAQTFDPSLSWRDLDWIRARTDRPLVVKGILTGADAVRARDAGVDAIVVSNHGGRQLDGAVASLDALAEIVSVLDDEYPVLVDGGVRRGTDAFTALALGARAVLLGRPPLWGLAVGGADGVAGLIRLATLELEQAMALTGRVRLADIDRSAVTTPG